MSLYTAYLAHVWL